MTRFRRCLLLAGVLPLMAVAAPLEDWTPVSDGYAWSFPQDHWPHRDYRIEWWYFTGHLLSETEPIRRFGYQFTLFRVGLTRQPTDSRSAWSTTQMIMGHASLTDKDRGEHRFSELLYRESPLLAQFATYPDQPIAWSRAPVGTDGTGELRWNGSGFEFVMQDARSGFALELSTQPVKPLVLHGSGGTSPKSDPRRANAAASLYYSLPRLETSGRVQLDGDWSEVQGTSWMDKEFSTSHLADDQVGWDWFSFQLDDGSELMLYQLRNLAGDADFAQGSWIAPNGELESLSPSEWDLVTTGNWRSDRTGAVYPSGWRVTLPRRGLELVVEPVDRRQENVSELVPSLVYWEGAVELRDDTGAKTGQGYVELTGYADGARPPL